MPLFPWPCPALNLCPPSRYRCDPENPSHNKYSPDFGNSFISLGLCRLSMIRETKVYTYRYIDCSGSNTVKKPASCAQKDNGYLLVFTRWVLHRIPRGNTGEKMRRGSNSAWNTGNCNGVEWLFATYLPQGLPEGNQYSGMLSLREIEHLERYVRIRLGWGLVGW